ncbi:MAG: hypothetical protein SFW63_06640 [Alphaproteobacteria bacterium]|nr:hypothetical protein [Alphaproteobacteria bacterium]
MKKKIFLGERVNVPPFDEKFFVLSKLGLEADPQMVDGKNYMLTLPDAVLPQIDKAGIAVTASVSEATGGKKTYVIDGDSVTIDTLINFVAAIKLHEAGFKSSSHVYKAVFDQTHQTIQNALDKERRIQGLTGREIGRDI